jgi:N-acetylglucosaminyl-diphospho-decaprenol L-rhamnosyltransferase
MADRSPRVGLVTVNYFSAALIDRLMASVAGQTMRPMHVVVVDNGDERPLDSRQIGAALPGIPVHIVETGVNRGYAAGVNAGVAALDPGADQVLLVNPDVRLASADLIERLAGVVAGPAVGLATPRIDSSKYRWAASRRFPSALALGANFLTRGIQDERALALVVGLLGHVPIDEARTRAVAHTNGAVQLVDRGAFDRVAGFDERFFLYGEEVDFCRRLAVAGLARAYVPDVRADHAGGASTARHAAARTMRLYLESMERYFDKWDQPVSRLVFAAAVRVHRRLRPVG